MEHADRLASKKAIRDTVCVALSILLCLRYYSLHTCSVAAISVAIVKWTCTNNVYSIKSGWTKRWAAFRAWYS